LWCASSFILTFIFLYYMVWRTFGDNFQLLLTCIRLGSPSLRADLTLLIYVLVVMNCKNFLKHIFSESHILLSFISELPICYSLQECAEKHIFFFRWSLTVLIWQIFYSIRMIFWLLLSMLYENIFLGTCHSCCAGTMEISCLTFY
jgi:hypothetical protein